jgi:hypothetical protein
MPRTKAVRNLSISDLERLLNSRRSQISKLETKRAKVLRKLKGIEDDIISLGGTVGGSVRVTGSVRASNTQTLPEVILQVLKGKASGMKVAEIVAASLAAGYQTKSDNFRSIVNQTLIKDKRFTKTGERGVYALKK